MKEKAIVFCENEFGKIDGKVTNGLVRYSGRYEIVGVIDSTKAGLDAGEHLDGIKKGIPILIPRMLCVEVVHSQFIELWLSLQA